MSAGSVGMMVYCVMRVYERVDKFQMCRDMWIEGIWGRLRDGRGCVDKDKLTLFHIVLLIHMLRFQMRG